MKRLLSAVVVAFVAFAPCAYADGILNINITLVTAFMTPNGGGGDNVSFTLIGPGTTITGTGGMACFTWCSGPIPDLNFVGTSQIYVGSFQTVIIDGRTFDSFGIQCCLFGFGGDLSGSAIGFAGSGDTFTQVNFTLPSGGWSLNFDFFPASGGSDAYYQFVNGTFVASNPVTVAATPEPGTLALMATGLAGLVGVIRRKRLICLRTAN